MTTTKQTELRPCPFCGGEARLDQRQTQSLWNSDDATFSHVSCDDCDIHGQDFCDDPAGEEAIEWWNTRAQLPSQGGEAVGEVRPMSDGKQYAALYTMAGQHLVGEKLYTHPSDQVGDDLTMVKVPRELLKKLVRTYDSSIIDAAYWTDMDGEVAQLRALLNGGRS